MRGQFAVADRRADAESAVSGFLDLVVRQAADVDEMIGFGHAQAHQVHQVRPAAEIGGTGPELPHGIPGVDGPLVPERPHGPATALIARTMFTYAPQRHRLPLIRSRISPGVSGGSAVRSSVMALGPGSVSRAAAEQSWPGVQ